MADLTILVNPATESLYARQLRAGLRRWRHDEPPAIISITSETDKANKLAWPIGRKLETTLSANGLQPPREYRMGHHQKPESDWTQPQLPFLYKTSGFHDDLVNAIMNYIEVGECENGRCYKLCGKGKASMNHLALPGYGYLVLQADQGLLHGHNGTGGIFDHKLERIFTSIVQDAIGGNYEGSNLHTAIKALE